MRKRFIREALDEYAGRHVPADRDLWPAIRERAQARRRLGAFWLPATRPGAVSPGGRARGEEPRAAGRGRRDGWSGVRRGANALAGLLLLAVAARPRRGAGPSSNADQQSPGVIAGRRMA
jgi:hypothetical protein